MSIALVTGGSRGIGQAVVEVLASNGYTVAFTYRENAGAAHDLRARLATGGHVSLPYRADVRDYARALEVVGEIKSSTGPIDLLVNNAGIRRDQALHTMDPDTWREVIETNLTGAFNYSRVVIGDMIRRGGVIINMGSVSGQIGLEGQTSYGASKAGLVGFTKALSREVARFGVRVNAIAPGLIDTEMTEGMPESARRKLEARIPAGRTGTAAEVARLVLYLASPHAAYITGQVLTIDGGMT